MMDEAPNTDLPFTQRIGPMLDELRSKNLLCDIILKVEAECFYAHRCVLAATSPYFKTMFTEDWAEGQQGVVDLSETKQCGFEEVLRFAYTGHAELNEENIENVLVSANHYCYPALSELCEKYIFATIDENNCLHYMRLAEMYDIHKILDKADKIVLKNYSTIIQNAEFLDISKEALCRFLVFDELHQNTKELVVFQSVCTWLTHHPDRTILAADVLKHIRFNLMSSRELLDQVVNSEVVRRDKLCFDMVLEKILSCTCERQCLTPQLHSPPVRDHDYMFLLYETGKILVGNFNEDSSFTSNDLSIVPNDVSRYRGVTYGNFLFLVLDRKDLDITTAKLLKYDVTEDRWEQMSGMKEVREGYALTVFGGSLIVLGGQNQSGARMSSAEQYNITADTWQEFTSAIHNYDIMAACACDGSLYFSGGSVQGDTGYLADMFVHCPATEEWKALDPVPVRLVNHNLVSLGSTIYSMGVTPENAFQCHLYKPDSNQWTCLKSTGSIVSTKLSAVVCENTIYTVGRCREHEYNGQCLLWFEHVEDNLLYHCLKTWDKVKTYPQLC